MGNIQYMSANVKPSAMTKRLRAHQGEVSFGSKGRPICVRTILGKRVEFFENGEHRLKRKLGVTEEEQYHSEILRFAHASLLINGPVGDKARIWVDATVEPANIWLYGMPAKQFVQIAKKCICEGSLALDFFVEQHPDLSEGKICHERDVQLHGRHPDRPLVPNSYVFQTDCYSDRIINSEY